MIGRRLSMPPLLAAIAAAAGCGPSSPGKAGQSSSETGDARADSSPSSSASSAPATAGEACLRLNEAEAQLAARCQGGAVADWRGNWSNNQDCAAFDRNLAAGLVEYRPEGWDACLAKYALPCAEANPYPCYYEILHGKVPDGQPCESTEVCGTVSGCINLGGATCGDQCVRLGVENEGCGVYCGTSTPCLEGGFCGSGLFCQSGTCVKTRAIGETCGGPDGITCGFWMYCDADPGDPAATGVCKRFQSGAVCRTSGECPPTEFCLAGTCTARRGAGAPCADQPDSCAPWTGCDLGGAQVCMHTARIGEACGPTPAAAFACVTGICDGLRCVPAATRGASCAADPCAQGAFCDQTTATCLACGVRS